MKKKKKIHYTNNANIKPRLKAAKSDLSSFGPFKLLKIPNDVVQVF